MTHDQSGEDTTKVVRIQHTTRLLPVQRDGPTPFCVLQVSYPISIAAISKSKESAIITESMVACFLGATKGLFSQSSFETPLTTPTVQVTLGTVINDMEGLLEWREAVLFNPAFRISNPNLMSERDPHEVFLSAEPDTKTTKARNDCCKRFSIIFSFVSAAILFGSVLNTSHTGSGCCLAVHSRNTSACWRRLVVLVVRNGFLFWDRRSHGRQVISIWYASNV